MKITVLSDGAWGTALACVLVNNGHDVTMWGPFPEYIEEMKKSRVNTKFLPGVTLDERLKFEADIAEALRDSSILLLASPSQYLRGVLDKLKTVFEPAKHLVINVAKGIEVDTWLRMSEVVASILGECRYVVLSGPSHAEEVSRKVPTLVVAASKDIKNAEIVRDLFMNDYFRVYSTSDILSVELGGALKNVMAIAAGIIDGMKLGDNPKAALITRGIAEMSRLGVALGGDVQTFSGLSGVGDLIVTCCSGHSRNRHVGECLGQGQKLDRIIADMGMVVAEGVVTAKGAKHLSETANVETPIINEIYNVLYNNKSAETAIRELMTRSPKHE
ncbi:MAG: NAD(P)-dependent glycerol-3-phosphate dehydrogenase [Lentisphaeria bacterium]|nr:NAD(P)-dependent glycerol-3-phosphate dehydrogenase [Lentisphaeria bacterium]